MTPDQIRDMLEPGRDDREVLDHWGCPGCGQEMSGYVNAGRTSGTVPVPGIHHAARKS